MGITSGGGIPTPWNLDFRNGFIFCQFRTVDAQHAHRRPGVDPGLPIRGLGLRDALGIYKVTVQIDLVNAVTVAAWVNGVQDTPLSGLSLGSDWLSASKTSTSPPTSTPLRPGQRQLERHDGGLQDFFRGGDRHHLLRTESPSSAAAAWCGSGGRRPGSARRFDDDHRQHALLFHRRARGFDDRHTHRMVTTTPATIQADRVVRFLVNGTGATNGFWLDNVGHSGPGNTVGLGEISGLSLWAAAGTAVLSYLSYNIHIEDCELAGGLRAFGSMNASVNYPLTIRNCYLSGADTAVYLYQTGFVRIEDVQIVAPARCIFRNFNSHMTVRTVFAHAATSSDFVVHNSGGGVVDLDGFFCDNESMGLGTKAVFYAAAGGDQVGTTIRVTNSSFSNVYPGSSVFVLDDVTPEDGYNQLRVLLPRGGPADLRLPLHPVDRPHQRAALGRATSRRRAGSDRPHWVENTDPNGVGGIVARHPSYTGPPRDGVWERNSNVLEAADPSVGHYARWRVLATGGYGTASPPVWQGFEALDDGLSLAAYIADHSYWSVSGSPAGSAGFWTNPVHALGLNALFGGTTPTPPGTLKAGLGWYQARRFKTKEISGNGYARVTLSGTPFSTSSGGVVTNAQAITFPTATGSWAPSPPEVVDALILFDSLGNQLAAMDIAPVVTVNGTTPSLGIGAVSLRPAASSGQGVFATGVHDLVNNFWLGGGTFAAPAIYVALSTAAAAVGSSPIEPVGGSAAGGHDGVELDPGREHQVQQHRLDRPGLRRPQRRPVDLPRSHRRLGGDSERLPDGRGERRQGAGRREPDHPPHDQLGEPGAVVPARGLVDHPVIGALSWHCASDSSIRPGPRSATPSSRLADGLFYDFATSGITAGTFTASPATTIAAVPADTGNFVGRYKVTLSPTPSAQFTDGDYCVTIHNMSASNTVVAEMEVVMHAGDDATVIPAGAGSDPWNQVLPGTYAAGTAGYALGTNLDVKLSSRLAAASYVALAPTDYQQRTQPVVLPAVSPAWVSQNSSTPTVAQIVAGIWDEPQAGHTVPGSLGASLDAAVSSRLAAAADTPGISTLLGRLTATRGAYLDALNISGTVASHADVAAVQNNTLVRIFLPDVVQRPQSGAVTRIVHLYTYDEQGNMATPDSAPTISVVNGAGASRNVNLDAPTMALVSTVPLQVRLHPQRHRPDGAARVELHRRPERPRAPNMEARPRSWM